MGPTQGIQTSPRLAPSRRPDHLGMLGDHILALARVGLEVVKLIVVHQRETRVLDCTRPEFRVLRFTLCPASDVMHERAVGPLGLRVLEQWQQTAAFDLLLHVVGE
jgi:hypothetical protein